MRKVLMRDYVDILSSSDIWEGGASRIGGIFLKKNISFKQNLSSIGGGFLYVWIAFIAPNAILMGISKFLANICFPALFLCRSLTETDSPHKLLKLPLL